MAKNGGRVAEGAWHVLLIGGAGSAGKTTCARQIAQRFLIDHIDLDNIWLGLRAATLPESYPTYHRFDAERLGNAPSPDDLLRWHIEGAEAMSASIAAVIAHQSEPDHPRAVVEGAWVTAAFAAGATGAMADPMVRAVFIHEPDREAATSVMRLRGATDPSNARHTAIEEMSWRYGNWLASEALLHHVPVVPARPRETLVERVLDVAR